MTRPRTPRRRPAPRPRRGRSALAATALVLAAVGVQAVTAGPAAATTAPLVTPEGIGIRIDETAIVGPVLEATEATLAADVQALLEAGADPNPGITGASQVVVDVDLALGLDVVAPGTDPDGSFAFEAELTGLEVTYTIPAHACTVEVAATTVTSAVTAPVDRAGLPATAFDVPDGTSSWPAWPSVSASALPCLLAVDAPDLSTWWTDLTDLGDPASTASLVEDELEGAIDTLLATMWAEQVQVILDSLATAVTVDRLDTDDHGLLVTAEVDATGGMALQWPARPR
ncbi:MAG TPA: hypothetical protein VEW93_04215 [Acidimicrobiales bacterium]|nr:hypothetical protein [Acidimicrobiales bacterium]